MCGPRHVFSFARSARRVVVFLSPPVRRVDRHHTARQAALRASHSDKGALPPSLPPYSAPQAESPSNLCPKECAESSIGDEACNVECYRASCDWDGGDCPGPTSKKKEDSVPDQCADGCPPYLIKDGSCDEACNVEACPFDGNQLTLLPTADPHHVSGDCCCRQLLTIVATW